MAPFKEQQTTVGVLKNKSKKQCLKIIALSDHKQDRK